ncbi:MAG: hypothetical protein ACE5FD_15170, partial [Anaerolineae bacterium]
GTNTYFIMEYRTPDTPSGGQYDANVASQGLALWYVQTNNNKNLVQLPSLTVPGKTDGANFSIGAPDYSRGGTQLWQHIDGILNPSWVNGVDTGLNIQAGPVLANTPIMEVEWGYGKPFTAYIAKLVGAQSGNSGSLITLDGLFGVANGGRVVSLTNGVDTYDLEIESWSCTRISVRVPVGVPAGSYKLRVYTDASHATGSNAVLYTVEGNNTITIPPGGSSFTIPDDGSAFTFPAGVFSETVIFHHTPVPSNTGSIPPFGDMIGMDRFFTVEANYVTSGRPAQPIQSYSVHIPYNEGQLDGVDESTLALYYWDEDRDQWIRESTGSVDTANNVLVANPNHFSLWAILGEAPGKHLIYLPFVQK